MLDNFFLFVKKPIIIFAGGKATTEIGVKDFYLGANFLKKMNIFVN
jgi:hypothetical protein